MEIQLQNIQVKFEFLHNRVKVKVTAARTFVLPLAQFCYDMYMFIVYLCVNLDIVISI